MSQAGQGIHTLRAGEGQLMDDHPRRVRGQGPHQLVMGQVSLDLRDQAPGTSA